ncbi:MAG TPA: nucleotidyl transferase AbiEii/AbiGii toxin family protein [Anaeromyxobacteraceae bacterium]|nr:nucleotidyl transferase AbiEii/AbiGii toxin family protein [Anaeromyxobacteraceae bacterium]
MIADKFVDLYARDSGLRDKLVAERDVVLTYALHALEEAGVMKAFAFKGGTCLRKTVFGSAGRFSEDLDFTLNCDGAEDDVLIELVAVFNREHHGITFAFEDYYKTEGDTSFGGEVEYRHAWNTAGRFRLQVSLRERPTLTVSPRPLKPQAYFSYLEFEPFEVRSLDIIEMAAEKVGAGFQRAKVRDLYDLYRFAATPFDVELLRRLTVLKLWQVRDPFDPEAFFQRIRSSKYDWDDLRRLMRASERLDAEEILRTVETRFAPLRQLSEPEIALIADARGGRNEPLADELRAVIRGWSR